MLEAKAGFSNFVSYYYSIHRYACCGNSTNQAHYVVVTATTTHYYNKGEKYPWHGARRLVSNPSPPSFHPLFQKFFRNFSWVMLTQPG